MPSRSPQTPKALEADIKTSMAALERRIEQEFKRAEPELMELAATGRYETHARFLQNVHWRVQPMREELQYLRRKLPPFTTYRDGIAYLHPVTPLNAHVLRRLP